MHSRDEVRAVDREGPLHVGDLVRDGGQGGGLVQGAGEWHFGGFWILAQLSPNSLCHFGQASLDLGAPNLWSVKASV